MARDNDNSGKLELASKVTNKSRIGRTRPESTQPWGEGEEAGKRKKKRSGEYSLGEAPCLWARRWRREGCLSRRPLTATERVEIRRNFNHFFPGAEHGELPSARASSFHERFLEGALAVGPTRLGSSNCPASQKWVRRARQVAAIQREKGSRGSEGRGTGVYAPPWRPAHEPFGPLRCHFHCSRYEVPATQVGNMKDHPQRRPEIITDISFK
ncbi:hypothetical protein B0J18DRAFT_243122 [Chaetomium sp. MPI-SDFR-AT-0129]|nr:hypothetical protein B0J18DRAFT_243122 [Chaetomium sp. MPI-SDFR-AT-0129]